MTSNQSHTTVHSDSTDGNSIPLTQSPSPKWRRAKGALGLASVLVAASACGTPSESESEPLFDSRTDYFAGELNGEFKGATSITALSTGTGDPSMCTPDGIHSKVIFTRDTSNFIQGHSDIVGGMSGWGKYGGAGAGRKFGGRPVCGFLAGSGNSYPFILFARGATDPNGGTDKRLYWSKGEWLPDLANPLPPTRALTQWAKVGDTQYSTNGNPVVATHSGQLVAVYLNDSGQLRGNYWDAAQGTLSGTLAGPALPAGWTGQGSPAIAFAGSWAQKFVIFVRAKNASNQVRLYQTFFEVDRFTGAIGGDAVYQQVTLPSGAPSVQSDPAYEFDSYVGWATLYYRNGNSIYHVSADVDDFGLSTVRAIDVGDTPSFTGNLNVIGGIPYEQGRHWVLARGKSPDTNTYFIESNNDETLTMN